MEIFVIALIVKDMKSEAISGFRLMVFDQETNEYETKDVTYSALFRILKSENAHLCKNAKIENGRIVGIGGKLDRYAKFDLSDKMKLNGKNIIVFKEVTDDKNKHLGYYVGSPEGDFAAVNDRQFIITAHTYGIANGKIMPGKNNGPEYVSPISGNYECVTYAKGKIPVRKGGSAPVKNTAPKQAVNNAPVKQNVKTQAQTDKTISQTKESTKEPDKSAQNENNTPVVNNNQNAQVQNNAQAQQNQNQAANNTEDDKKRYPEAVKLIKSIENVPSYRNSFASKIAISVTRWHKCSEKQYKILADFAADNNIADPNKNISANVTVNTNTQATPAQVPAQTQATPAQVPAQTQATPAQVPAQTQATPAQVPAQTEEESEEDRIAAKVAAEKNRISSREAKILAEDENYNDNSDSTCFTYKKMENNKIYVSGFKPGMECINVVIPDFIEINGMKHKVEGIGIKAFANQRSIRTVVTGKNISDIGQSAFANCARLSSIDISNSKQTMIPSGMCYCCSWLRNVKVNSTLERIHESAFEGCGKLESVEGLQSVDTIARCAFKKCELLTSLNCKVKIIGEQAFAYCYMFESFDFSEVQSIGSNAFRGTCFKNLVLPGNVRELGHKAFADCAVLETVKIEEGVEVLKEYVFAKSDRSCLEQSDFIEKYGVSPSFVEIQEIEAGKSIQDIGNDAFRHCKLVSGYTGTPVESHCKGFGVTFSAKDTITTDNSSKVRIMSRVLSNSQNIAKTIYTSLTSQVPGSSNPDYALKTDKLVKKNFTSFFGFFNIPAVGAQVEPHIKFKAAVNYLQDVTDLYPDPLTNALLRLQKAFYITSETIYDDGYNRIYKCTYAIKDNLEEGSFIIVLIGPDLVYMTDVTIITNIEMNSALSTDDKLALSRYLHAGDKIGVNGVLSGEQAQYKDESGPRTVNINVGQLLYEKLLDNSMIIKPTRGERWLWVPCEKTALKLFDYKKDENSKNTTIDSYSVTEITDYAGFLTAVKKLKKKGGLDNKKFFDQVKAMSASEVATKLKTIDIVEEEKEAQLFQVSKDFNALLESKGMSVAQNNIDYNVVTPEIFKELSRSYWMISKDEYWYNTNGSKSLNKMSEYKVGKYLLLEYKSNQIVKFSNPYMNGQKGAYVYVLKNGVQILGVYASRYDYKTLISMLSNLTYIPVKHQSDIYPVLMTDPNELDMVDTWLMQKFYDILSTTNAYNIYNIIDTRTLSNYSWRLQNSFATFGIYMYKPTGVFYLAMDTFVKKHEYKNGSYQEVEIAHKILPILPIGNMDRALIVATTTNNKSRKSQLFEELVALAAYVILKYNAMKKVDNFSINNIGVIVSKVNNNIKTRKFDIENYMRARALAISGAKKTADYAQYICDRAVYMLGTVHKGKLQREYGQASDEEYDLSDILDEPEEVEEPEVYEESEDTENNDYGDLDDVLDEVLGELGDEEDDTEYEDLTDFDDTDDNIQSSGVESISADELGDFLSAL